MIRRETISLALAVVMAACATSCRRAERPGTVVIATTPDVAATGLPQMLTERFSLESKVATEIVVTDATLMAPLFRKGQVDVVLTSSAVLGASLRQAGLVRLDQVVAYNDYLLVGPARDPARARDAKTAAEALRRIARRDRAFCTPVDVPEFRHREAALWELSPAEPADDRRYRRCRGTPEEVLRIASRIGAYTLTDRATFERAKSKLDLQPLLHGTPMLHNDVRVVLARPARPDPDAEWFVQWLLSFRGRDAIERYRFDGDRRFFVREH